MDFMTPAHREVYERIAEWMPELFGMFVQAIPDKPVFIFNQGDTLAQVTVVPWSDDDATITVRSYVIHDVDSTQELMSRLLHANAGFRFGAFGMDDDDDVFFEHTIVGSTCDPEELKASVLAVTNTSDRFAEELIPLFGGIRTREMLEEKARSAL